MNEVFGVPLNYIMLVLLAVFLLLAGLLAVVAVRNPVMFKMGIRNIPRRPAQTVLIVMGLMLATLIISAALGTGDTMTHTIRSTALENLGQVDEIIVARGTEELLFRRGQNPMFQGAQTGIPYFNYEQFQRLSQAQGDNEAIDGLAPLVLERAPVLSPRNRLSEPFVYILGLDAAYQKGFGPIVSVDGRSLSTADLAPGEVYINKDTAEELSARAGDELLLFVGDVPYSLRVRDVLTSGYTPSAGPAVVMSLAEAQAAFQKAGQINAILVSNQGDALSGVRHTDALAAQLEPFTQSQGLSIQAVKQKALDEADTVGSAFTSIFVVFGLFSVAAGVMLIFLIFVMLAAERQSEMGMARAVGAQRRHLIQMFVFEGAAYALVASAIGALLGIGISLVMVRVMVVAFSQWDITLYFNYQPRSLVVAYTLGVLATLLVVAFSAWRVSRLNIVRAIRDLPEPQYTRGSRRWMYLGILGVFLGILMTWGGLGGRQLAPFMLGTSLILISSVPLLRRLGVPDRLAYSFAGVGLLVWWLLPKGTIDRILPEMNMGIEMFFLSGIMIVAGAVWVVVYNSDVVLALLLRVASRLRGLAPVAKMAVSYPMYHRFRTGMALAMFSLIIFTMIFMSVMVAGNQALFADEDSLAGGFQIRGDVSYNTPVADMGAAIRQTSGLNPADFEVIAQQSVAPIQVRQVGASSQEWRDYLLKGVDNSFLGNTTYKFALIARGYNSNREVWEALRDDPNLAVIDALPVPARANFNVGMMPTDFRVEGIYIDDKDMEPFTIQVQDPRTGVPKELKVVGVIESTAMFTFGIYTSQASANSILNPAVPATTYWFRLRPGTNVASTAKALEAAFLERGMQATVLSDVINDISQTSRMMNGLLQGFLALGLIVGIAALGVISARSVVERRQQIGMLRAIGFQRGMVQFSFLLESSFVAILGIAIGVALGLALSYNVVAFVSEDIEGFTYHLPWLEVIIIAVLAYGASLLTTILPARQAAGIYPAEALRYE